MRKLALVIAAALPLQACAIPDLVAHVVKLNQSSGSGEAPAQPQAQPTAYQPEAAPPAPTPAVRESITVESLPLPPPGG